jgi:GMP synthase (glutamine-hydrolysing)
MMHRASATIPEQFMALAYSDRCSNIIMKHKRKPIYGFQAHPELSPSGITFFKNFVSLAEAHNAFGSIEQTMELTP